MHSGICLAICQLVRPARPTALRPQQDFPTTHSSGALKRAANYASGNTQHKVRKIPVYKDITLVRNGVKKVVKSNQVPAYAKSGWQRE